MNGIRPSPQNERLQRIRLCFMDYELARSNNFNNMKFNKTKRPRARSDNCKSFMSQGSTGSKQAGGFVHRRFMKFPKHSIALSWNDCNN